MHLRQLSPHELAYQESLIQEREDEIREIETGIHELSEIFRDLGTLVTEQGGMLGACRSCCYMNYSLSIVRDIRQHRVKYPLDSERHDGRGAGAKYGLELPTESRQAGRLSPYYHRDRDLHRPAGCELSMVPFLLFTTTF